MSRPKPQEQRVREALEIRTQLLRLGALREPELAQRVTRAMNCFVATENAAGATLTLPLAVERKAATVHLLLALQVGRESGVRLVMG